ncbi:hypothetical protein T484DRAFT_1888658, partial [Baffinella frigidus]
GWRGWGRGQGGPPRWTTTPGRQTRPGGCRQAKSDARPAAPGAPGGAAGVAVGDRVDRGAGRRGGRGGWGWKTRASVRGRGWACVCRPFRPRRVFSVGSSAAPLAPSRDKCANAHPALVRARPRLAQNPHPPPQEPVRGVDAHVGRAAILGVARHARGDAPGRVPPFAPRAGGGGAGGGASEAPLRVLRGRRPPDRRRIPELRRRGV